MDECLEVSLTRIKSCTETLGRDEFTMALRDCFELVENPARLTPIRVSVRCYGTIAATLEG